MKWLSSFARAVVGCEIGCGTIRAILMIVLYSAPPVVIGCSLIAISSF
jgi:hypothetical protein